MTDPFDKLRYKENDEVWVPPKSHEKIMGKTMYAVVLSTGIPFLFHSDFEMAKDVAHNVGGEVKKACVAFHVLQKRERCVS